MLSPLRSASKTPLATILITSIVLDTDFRYGLKVGLLYYVTAAAFTCLSYFVFGNDYGHVPGPYLLIGIMFLLARVGWMLYYLIWLLAGYRAKVNFGILTVHLIVVLSLILIVYIDIKVSDVAEYKNNPADVITIGTDASNNVFSVVNEQGDTCIHGKVTVY